MVGTIVVHGSGGEVMAPLPGQRGEFFRGRPVMVRVTGVSEDESDPLELRQALVGVKIRTIFDHQQLCAIGRFEDVVPEGSRVAYAGDVAEALRQVGKNDAADMMMTAGDGDKLSLYVVEAGVHEIV